MRYNFTMTTVSIDRYWTIELERRRCGRKARLMVALMKCFSWRLVVQGISILIEVNYNTVEKMNEMIIHRCHSFRRRYWCVSP